MDQNNKMEEEKWAANALNELKQDVKGEEKGCSQEPPKKKIPKGNMAKCKHDSCSKMVMKAGKRRNYYCEEHKKDKYISKNKNENNENNTNSNQNNRQNEINIDHPLFPRDNKEELSIEARSAVVVLSVAEFKLQTISNVIPCSTSTVSRLKKRFRDTEDMNSIYDEERSGRPSILKEEEKELIVGRTLIDPKHADPRLLLNELNLNTCPRTIRRTLNSVGLLPHIQQRMPPLTAAHKQKRVSFAEGYLNIKWSLVVAADETIFSTNDTTQRFVQCGPGEQYLPENMKAKEAHPPSINAWGCFSIHGVGTLYTFTETMDSQYYSSILNECLPESVESFFNLSRSPKQWYFLQDGSGPHRGPEARHWLHNNGVTCIDFPPNSPDLNPIEDLWANMCRRMFQYHAITKDELTDAVHKAWEATSPRYCAKLMRSMKKRCELIIKNEGNHIKY